jgi:hypothetical protein
MTGKLLHGTIADSPRRPIHVLVVDKLLQFPEVSDIADKMRGHLLSKHGDQNPNVVVVHGHSGNLHLVGESHAVARVRTALFNAAVTLTPLSLDLTNQS